MSVKSIKTTLETIDPYVQWLNSAIVVFIEALVFVMASYMAYLIVTSPLEGFSRPEEGIAAGVAGVSVFVAALIFTRWARSHEVGVKQ